MKNRAAPRFVIVTGYSGAGLTTALNALQDNGFHCIDNLPVEMADAAVDLLLGGKYQTQGIALGMDIRDARIAENFVALKNKLAKKVGLDVVFISASLKVLLERFNSSRRPHPLFARGTSLESAIQKEIRLLKPIRNAADVIFDTSDWSPHFLTRMMERRYEKEIPPRKLYVMISSFGFKHGSIPQLEALYDVRFLNNPYFVPELKKKSGLDKEVRAYVLKDARVGDLLKHLGTLNQFLLPNYFTEGKHYYRIGIGCTGGRHRSVVVAEELAAALRKNPPAQIEVQVGHRDLEKEEHQIFE